MAAPHGIIFSKCHCRESGSVEDISPDAPVPLRGDVISPFPERRGRAGYDGNGHLEFGGDSGSRAAAAANKAEHALKALLNFNRALVEHGYFSSRLAILSIGI